LFAVLREEDVGGLNFLLGYKTCRTNCDLDVNVVHVYRCVNERIDSVKDLAHWLANFSKLR